jgi:hypothetical protein
VQRASKALLRAKELGRNRVECARVVERELRLDAAI